MTKEKTLSLFKELESSQANDKVVAHLESLVTKGSDHDCYKINAFRLAQELSVSRREALRALLFATRIGLFDLNFDVHCPSCFGVPAYYKHLMGLKNNAHCPLCEIDWSLDFEEQVEVTFTVNEAIRKIKYADWVERDFEGMMEWLDDMLVREKRELALGICVEPGETKTAEVAMEDGEYVYYMPSHRELGGMLIVEGEKTNEKQVVTLKANQEGEFDTRELHLKPGPVEFTVSYDYPHFNGFLVVSTAPRNNWVSAAYLMAQQDFRSLFEAEYLAPETSFAIQSVTLLFTDITSSTEMYERLGDGKAYNLVQEHFKVMTDIIAEHEGGIVKTIGDAVMAAFPNNCQGLKAACLIQEAFAQRDDILSDVTIKIGLHRGPTIAVTSNRATDYFGRTVNIAARVQGKSGPGEVVVSHEVLDCPEVKEFLDTKNYPATEKKTTLKGIEGEVQVTVFTPKAD